jgi:exodeoxyribonuclease VII small subunit
MARKKTSKKQAKTGKVTAGEETSLSFEDSLERLETLVAKLEEGEVPLEESLQAYVEGTRLVRACLDRLDRAEATILKLSEEGGSFQLEPGLGDGPRARDAGAENGDDNEEPDGEEKQDELPF